MNRTRDLWKIQLIENTSDYNITMNQKTKDNSGNVKPFIYLGKYSKMLLTIAREPGGGMGTIASWETNCIRPLRNFLGSSNRFDIML